MYPLPQVVDGFPAPCGRRRTRALESMRRTSTSKPKPVPAKSRATPGQRMTFAQAMMPIPSVRVPICAQGTPGVAFLSGRPVPRNSHVAAPAKINPRMEKSQNTPRQFPASAKIPPISGPNIVAVPHIAAVAAKMRARCRSGKETPMATMANPDIQPPPIPCTSRPAMNIPIVGAAAFKRQPAAKTSPATPVARRSPTISESRPALAQATTTPSMNPAAAQPK